MGEVAVNGGEYGDWMARAFLFVEAALAQELATPSRVCMTEDYFRSALVRGLANSMPAEAHRVHVEQPATFGPSNCWNACGASPGRGRPLQHDVAAAPEDGDENDRGLICEVKWLKQAQSQAVARDVLKLAFARGVAPEGTAVRCYLLLGGEAEAFSQTLTSLRENGIDLRWRNAQGQAQPARRSVNMNLLLRKQLGERAFMSLMGWGSNPRHFRTPPDCWRHVVLTRRGQPWRRTLDDVGWRACLFEMHHRNALNTRRLDATSLRETVNFDCRPVL